MLTMFSTIPMLTYSDSCYSWLFARLCAYLYSFTGHAQTHMNLDPTNKRSPPPHAATGTLLYATPTINTTPTFATTMATDRLGGGEVRRRRALFSLPLVSGQTSTSSRSGRDLPHHRICMDVSTATLLVACNTHPSHVVDASWSSTSSLKLGTECYIGGIL
jgi:hypothetical protein